MKCLHAIRNIRNGREGVVALKFNMSKAYDRVEWVFLERIMTCLGFHADWVALVTHCISSVYFSVIINGEPKGKIIPNIGLR